jgi:hypothetical protein
MNLDPVNAVYVLPAVVVQTMIEEYCQTYVLSRTQLGSCSLLSQDKWQFLQI